MLSLQLVAPGFTRCVATRCKLLPQKHRPGPCNWLQFFGQACPSNAPRPNDAIASEAKCLP